MAAKPIETKPAPKPAPKPVATPAPKPAAKGEATMKPDTKPDTKPELGLCHALLACLKPRQATRAAAAVEPDYNGCYLLFTEAPNLTLA